MFITWHILLNHSSSTLSLIVVKASYIFRIFSNGARTLNFTQFVTIVGNVRMRRGEQCDAASLAAASKVFNPEGRDITEAEFVHVVANAVP